MNQVTLIEHARKLLLSDPDYEEDARTCPPGIDNTIVGSVLALTTGQTRRTTEAAVRKALARIDMEKWRRGKEDGEEIEPEEDEEEEQEYTFSFTISGELTILARNAEEAETLAKDNLAIIQTGGQDVYTNVELCYLYPVKP